MHWPPHALETSPEVSVFACQSASLSDNICYTASLIQVFKKSDFVRFRLEVHKIGHQEESPLPWVLESESGWNRVFAGCLLMGLNVVTLLTLISRDSLPSNGRENRNLAFVIEIPATADPTQHAAQGVGHWKLAAVAHRL